MFKFVLMDIETTGLDRRSSRIISIGAKALHGSRDTLPDNSLQQVRTLTSFHAFVNPGQTNGAYEINQIPDEFLVDKPSFAQVAQDFWAWIWDLYHTSSNAPIVLIGHNFDNFDEPMLIAEHHRHKCTDLIPRGILYKVDTMKFLKYIFPQTVKSVPYGLPVSFHGPVSYRQADIYEFLFGTPPSMQHSALGDVYALERILHHPSVTRLLVEIKRPDPIAI
jgi:DNA polymerase III epsilon subunit-like protein